MQIILRLGAVCLILWGMWKTIPDAIHNYTVVQSTLVVCGWCLMLIIALAPFVFKSIQKLF